MDTRAEAELARLRRAVETGPGRRMADDTRAGRTTTRTDQQQLDRYLGLIAALEAGRT